MKKLLAMILACAMALPMAACGNNASSIPANASGTSGEQGGAKDPVTVTVWHLKPEDTEETSEHQRLLRWAEKFNAENTDNKTKAHKATTSERILPLTKNTADKAKITNVTTIQPIF